MARKLLTILIAFFVLLAFTSAFSGEEKSEKGAKKNEYQYIGAKKCKMCHKKDGTHPSWLETKHAKAWESLDEKAQKDEKCVTCHSTGTTAKGDLLTGVQCEACHGPGSDYKKKSVMQDREKAIAAGLLMPNEETCKKCHNENVPAEFRPKEGYNFAEMMKTGIHDLPSKDKEKKPEGK